MDRHTKKQRSYNMSQVKSKNTLPERIVFEELSNKGFKFNKHFDIQGKPDVAFPKEKVVVFIDGEFWHGRNFNKLKKTLSKFWVKKIGNNIKRDRKNKRELRNKGWKVIRLWGKEILKNPEKEVKKITKHLKRSSD
jgi:DNA mismatch endonuclease (patch repair protein)